MNVRSLRTALAATLMTLSLGAATLLPVAPAEAGSITLKISPKGKKAKQLQQGLAIFGALQNARNVAKAYQNGNGNAIGGAQNGSGNVLGVIQEGDGHTAVATQNGGNNALGIIQFGKGTHTDVSQNGGETGLIIQGGW
jgi:hypothetical protein